MWMCGVNSTTQTFHSTRAYIRVALFRPDTNASLTLINTHTLTYTTQLRSSGSQVYVGNNSHRAEPLPVLRRAPTLSDEQRQQRVGIRLAEVREGETGKAKVTRLTSRPQESSTQSLTLFHTAKPLETCKLCTWLYFAPIKKSPCVTDDNSLTK